MKVSCFADYQIVETESGNISMSGAMLKSPREYTPGEELIVVFNTPNARRPLTIPAEVVWSDMIGWRGGKLEFQLGVKYLYLNSDHQKIFNDFLSVSL